MTVDHIKTSNHHFNPVKVFLWSLMLFGFILINFGCTKTTPTHSITPTLVPSPTQGLLPNSYLSKTNVQHLFKIAEEYVVLAGNTKRIEFHCTIVEGTFCWYSDEDLGGALYGRISKELARSIVDEIDPGVIEQAQDNEIRIRCSMPAGADHPITCEGNWGWEDAWILIDMK